MSANHNSQADNNTRLKALFGALRERESLLTDDEIRNIVRTEAARTSASQKASRGVGFPQRFFTKKTMLISSVVAAVFASAVFLTSSLFWKPSVPQTSSKAVLTQKKQIEQQSIIANSANTLHSVTQASSRKSVSISTIEEAKAQTRTNNVEGAHILELNEAELLRLGLVLDSFGGIHKAIKRPPTGLEKQAYDVLKKPIQEIEGRQRLDLVAILPPLELKQWYRKALGKGYQEWETLGELRIAEKLKRTAEENINYLIPRNQWNAARFDSLDAIRKIQNERTTQALAKLTQSEVSFETSLLTSYHKHLATLAIAPELKVVFARSSTGKEQLPMLAKRGRAYPLWEYGNINIADSLEELIVRAKSKEESDKYEAALKKIYKPISSTDQSRIMDSVDQVYLQRSRDTVSASLLLGITISRGTSSMILWCQASPEVIAALPDRYRIPLERELAAAQKYSSLCEIPNREEREELERVIAGKPFLETWRSCAGALTAKSIAPNPAQHEATVRFSLSVPRSVSAALHDIRGQHLETLHTAQSFGTGEHTLSVNLTKHIAGMYLLVLTTQQGEQTVQRVMIEK